LDMPFIIIIFCFIHKYHDEAYLSCLLFMVCLTLIVSGVFWKFRNEEVEIIVCCMFRNLINGVK